MAYLDSLLAAQDALYARMGVAASWTPAGGVLVACTALQGAGDQAMAMRGVIGRANVEVRTIRVRVRELAATAPGVTPLQGDAVVTPDGNFLITGDPRHPDTDHRRLEWEFDLADA